MPTIDEARQRAYLQWLIDGREFCFGNPHDCPLPLPELATLDARSSGVEAVLDSGLTAVVYKLRVGARCYAVKRARSECKVRNVDGQTSFLNELQRHAEIRALRDAGTVFPSVITPLYGSLRHGLLVSPWIEGRTLDRFDERQLTQLFEAGRGLVEQGFFEWDYSPGNVLDDGERVWLFDFGYMYRFDPLTQFNSAGQGDDLPLLHLAERIETRNVFAWLLEIEQQQGEAGALARFRDVKRIALASYCSLRAALEQRGARQQVLDWLGAITVRWQRGLAGDLAPLYLAEGWRSHALDLHDDLSGQTCTPRTLARADWLIRAADSSHAALQASGALQAEDATRSREQLTAHCQALREQALRHLIR